MQSRLSAGRESADAAQTMDEAPGGEVEYSVMDSSYSDCERKVRTDSKAETVQRSARFSVPDRGQPSGRRQRRRG